MTHHFTPEWPPSPITWRTCMYMCVYMYIHQVTNLLGYRVIIRQLVKCLVNPLRHTHTRPVLHSSFMQKSEFGSDNCF